MPYWLVAMLMTLMLLMIGIGGGVVIAEFMPVPPQLQSAK